MNIRKNIDFSAMYVSLDTLMTQELLKWSFTVKLERLWASARKRELQWLQPNTLQRSTRMFRDSLPGIFAGCGIFTGLINHQNWTLWTVGGGGVSGLHFRQNCGGRLLHLCWLPDSIPTTIFSTTIGVICPFDRSAGGRFHSKSSAAGRRIFCRQRLPISSELP